MTIDEFEKWFELNIGNTYDHIIAAPRFSIDHMLLENVSYFMKRRLKRVAPKEDRDFLTLKYSKYLK